MTDESIVRKERLTRLREEGIEPYPAESKRTHTAAEALAQFEALQKKRKSITLVGRVRSIRGHGGSTFAHLEDGSGRIQVYLKQDTLGEDQYRQFVELFDVGDFLEATGTPFVTKRGEKTLEVAKYRLLAKTLEPLPEKWHGLTDVEIRYRKRYLDLLANPDVHRIFETRSAVVTALREFLHGERFLEVETPVLQPIPGGASAAPFITHHNALGVDLFLRIAPELYLKRLLVGGFERVFEIARCFRNEGIDHAHNPEFTQVEFYQAYATAEDLLELTERLLLFLLDRIGMERQFEYDGNAIKVKPQFARIRFRDAIKKYAELDIENYADQSSLLRIAQERGTDVPETASRGKIFDELFKTHVRPKLVQPTFVTDHPIELSPLAKKSAADPRYADRFQLVIGGMELVNAFSELNDPMDQRKRFEEQEQAREKGDEESQRIDEDYLEALAHGMPPAAGFGMGIDRLVMLLTNSHSIKESILFPTLKPREKLERST